MDNSTNTFGIGKKELAMKLYGMLIDEDFVSFEEYGVERFLECFNEVFMDYSLFLKSSVIE